MLKVLEYEKSRACFGPVYETVCEILADAESDIMGIGETVTDDSCEWPIKPLPGSYAVTADGTVGYVVAPSGNWVRIGGGA